MRVGWSTLTIKVLVARAAGSEAVHRVARANVLSDRKADSEREEASRGPPASPTQRTMGRLHKVVRDDDGRVVAPPRPVTRPPAVVGDDCRSAAAEQPFPHSILQASIPTEDNLVGVMTAVVLVAARHGPVDPHDHIMLVDLLQASRRAVHVSVREMMKRGVPSRPSQAQSRDRLEAVWRRCLVRCLVEEGRPQGGWEVGRRRGTLGQCRGYQVPIV